MRSRGLNLACDPSRVWLKFAADRASQPRTWPGLRGWRRLLARLGHCAFGSDALVCRHRRVWHRLSGDQCLVLAGRTHRPLHQLKMEKKIMADTTAPADVAAPPADAQTTASGLAYRVLQAGSGESPAKTDTVRVHYTGWTTDGKKFDSSHDRNRAAEFPLNRVIAGWTEGVSLMNRGARWRFWIPEQLAYQGAPGYPQGMLVFDVELLEILG
ncbi:MAG: FKBP-type peptidyl-prolyl cis-trans isomerase [Bradymonadaceae bacterium]|nr:FKBP-type peptidyl-prolyl cis-trans isomerase [Lujinxingiaceae bacterium]